MAKKKVQTGKVILLAAALLGVVAICMLFAPGITEKVAKKSGSISGFKVMFGAEDGLAFNFMMFLSLLFTLVGLVGVVLALLLGGKIGGFLAIVGFLLAGIFFFCFRAVFPMGVKDMSIMGTTVLSGKEAVDALEKIGITFSLGAGAIVAGILSILAAAASAVATFVVKD